MAMKCMSHSLQHLLEFSVSWRKDTASGTEMQALLHMTAAELCRKFVKQGNGDQIVKITNKVKV